MKKLLLLSLICIFSIAVVYAQSSMTDEQVVEYVKQAHERGLGQKEIAIELMKRGVSKEQLQRVKEKYENLLIFRISANRTLRLPIRFVIVGSFRYHQNYTTFIKKATTKSIF